MPKLIMVLGMHRSGTSLIAKALNVFGVNLGENLMPARPRNPKGFFEDLDFNQINNNLLKDLSLRWSSLHQPEDVEFSRLSSSGLFQNAVKLIQAKRQSYPRFAVKDPRFSRLMPFWLKVLVETNTAPTFVVALRHPMNVAKSLQERNHFPISLGLELWKLHTALALVATSGKPRVVVEYESLVGDPQSALKKLGADLRLELIQEQSESFCRSFVDKKLDHGAEKPHYEFSEECPAHALYEILKLAVTNGEAIGVDDVLQNMIQQHHDRSALNKLIDQLVREGGRL